MLSILSLLFCVNWYTPNIGLPLAKSTHKPFLIYYHTSWCGYCKIMDRTVFNDTNLNIDSLVPIALDCDSDDTITVKGKVITYKSFCNEMNVHSYPSFKVLKYNGKVKKTFVGGMNRKTFEREIKCDRD